MSTIERGATRERIGEEELREQQARGVIVANERRRRPLWFDGRFLDAEALRAEQNYLLARQADFGRAAGAGVVEGLWTRVEAGSAATVTIEPGSGLTATGQSVVIERPLTVDLADVAASEGLDLRFGLATLPRSSPVNRTGLFVLGLRPVEYEADPMTLYPTSVEGERSRHNGSVVEATAVSLVPFPEGLGEDPDAARRRAARRIFIERERRGVPENLLPLAMVAFEQGAIVWLDPYLARRDLARDTGSGWWPGGAGRALRAAHLGHYIQHLEALEGAPGGVAAATDHFGALPPAGPLPEGAVDVTTLRQRFFPPTMEVVLAVIPDDELPALIDESLALPPFDLDQPEARLRADAVAVVVPLPRHRLAALQARLESLERDLDPALPDTSVDVLKAIADWSGADASSDTEDETDTVWRELLAEPVRLWYLRRRNLAHRVEVAGVKRVLAGDEWRLEERVDRFIGDLNVRTGFNAVLRRSTRGGAAALYEALGSLAESSPLVVRALVTELQGRERIDRKAVAEVAGRYGEPGFGEGLARLEKIAPGKWIERTARLGLLWELDRAAAALDDEKLKEVAGKLRPLALDGKEQELAEVLKEIGGE